MAAHAFCQIGVIMQNETVFEWLKERGFPDRLTEHAETIDTVEHAKDGKMQNDVFR